jgi:hypothetical protein
MRRDQLIGFACVAVLALFVSSAPVQAQEKDQAAASAAATASPALIGELTSELGATPEQAAGAAGTLFGIAKTNLSPEDFSQVSSAVPGMDLLLKAAPPSSLGPVGITGPPPVGATSGLASAAAAFTKLGLKPDMVSKAVPILTSYVSKTGGANVGSLLAGALK